MSRYSIVLCLFVMAMNSTSVQADVVTFNGNGQPISITGLSVPNEALLFDVTITYNVSFNSIFGPGNPTPSVDVPYFWGNQTQAFAAGNAIRNTVLNAPGYNSNSNFLIATPFTIFYSDAQMDDVTNSASFLHTGPFKGANSFVGQGGFGGNSQAIGLVNGWARFTAVPEPSSLLVLGSFVAAVGLHRRKRS